jgi:polyisoprenyl-teichoic acid--peptidoglycan teichoic acid transferase
MHAMAARRRVAGVADFLARTSHLPTTLTRLPYGGRVSCVRGPLSMTVRTAADRRTRGRGVVPAASGLCVALLLTACSGGGGTATPSRSTTPAGASSSTSTGGGTPSPGTTTSAPAASGVSAKGVPADLVAALRPLYAGGRVTAPAKVTAALAGRRVPAAPVSLTGSTGTWKGTPVAVVTAGKDVTLAVKAPTWRVVGGWWPSLGVKAPQLGGNRRVLLIGSDARTLHGQKVDRSRADSLHVVGVDGHGGGGVLGFARDAYVPLSTGGQDKINAAMVYGGPEAELQTVRNTTGLPIEGYLLTGFGGFRRIVNGAGGLPITLPKAVHDTASKADLGAGRQELDGKQALAYSRARKSVAGGDFGRSANQGLVILAAAAMTRLVGPSALPSMLARAAPSLKTDLSAEQVLTLAATVFVTGVGKVGNRVAKGGFGTTSGGASIVRLDGQARRYFADLRDGNLS